MTAPDRQLKKMALKTRYLREELYDIEEEFDRRGWQLNRAVMELLARAGQLFPPKKEAQSQSQGGAAEAPDAEAPAADPEGSAETPESSPWHKKIFRKISMKTHPDALVREDLSEREKQERSKMFLDAKAALESADGTKLLEIATELDIDVDDVPVEEHILSMERLAGSLEERISKIKQTVAWIWGEGKRKETLAHVCKLMGWNGSDPGLLDAILSWVDAGFVGGVSTYTTPEPEKRRARPTRKIGERPEKMSRR